jgi:hypothetical protein
VSLPVLPGKPPLRACLLLQVGMSFHVNSSAECLYRRMHSVALQQCREASLWDAAARVVGALQGPSPPELPAAAHACSFSWLLGGRMDD